MNVGEAVYRTFSRDSIVVIPEAASMMCQIVKPVRTIPMMPLIVANKIQLTGVMSETGSAPPSPPNSPLKTVYQTQVAETKNESRHKREV